MKIALVFDGLGIGGIERVGVNYARMLCSLGHDVTIFNLQPDLADMEVEFPEECDIIRSSFSKYALPESFFAVTKRTWGKYVYPPVYLIAKIGLLIKKLCWKTTCKEDHFDVAIAFAGHFRDLSFVAYEFIKAYHKIAWLHGSLADYLLLSYSYGFLYRKIRNLCTLSDANQGYALEVFPEVARSVRITKIYNPIQTEPSPSNCSLTGQLKNSEDDLLVMGGRFDKDKDQETVIRALKILHEKHAKHPKLLFVGDGPTRTICEQLAHDLGLAASIDFVGAKSNVDDYLLAATIAVHSSSAEGLPTVLLEAMRDGVPIVATNSLPGVSEILGNDEYGLTCAVEDPEDMAAKIQQMLEDPELRSCYVEQGLKRVQDFSFDTISRQLETILSQLVPAS